MNKMNIFNNVTGLLKRRKMEALEKEVIEIIGGMAAYNGICFSDNADLRADLLFDSIDFIDLAIKLERKFGIKVEDEDLLEASSVFDVVEMVKLKLENKWKR